VVGGVVGGVVAVAVAVEEKETLIQENKMYFLFFFLF
jgi:hypothetical protein